MRRWSFAGKREERAASWRRKINSLVRRVLVSKDPEVASSWRHLGISGLEAERTAGASINGNLYRAVLLLPVISPVGAKVLQGPPHAGGEHDGRAVQRAFIWRRPPQNTSVCF